MLPPNLRFARKREIKGRFKIFDSLISQKQVQDVEELTSGPQTISSERNFLTYVYVYFAQVEAGNVQKRHPKSTKSRI